MKLKRILCLILTLAFFSNTSVFASDNTKINTVIQDTAQYICESVPSPKTGSIGGEWCVLGLARSDADIPDKYFENYYEAVEKYVSARNGVLHESKHTEYSRLIIALTSIGKNPLDVSGYNLLVPLGDYENTIFQGINGAIWALIALDSGNYEIPRNINAKTQATRELYIDYILDNQMPNGGWALSGDIADPDVTAMALQALSKYLNNENVKNKTDKAITCMSEIQNENGGFSSRGTESSESCAQMIVALCELGISPFDSRFVKNGNTLIDNLLSYRENKKGFKHTSDGTSNQMATEQCFYALVALNRFNENKNSLYNMNDAISVSNDSLTSSTETTTDIKKTSVYFPGKTFSDITEHQNKPAIEALAERNIINGKSENLFEPNSTMTRAEFAAVTVRSLGLSANNSTRFTDVTSNDWFYDSVNTAHFYGIVNGISDTEFNPDGTVTREEAAVMIVRAAKLCGNDTYVQIFAARDTLAAFIDYVSASDWAITSLAFCYDKQILSDDVTEINPKESVTRAEIAQMIYNMLLLSNLI